MTQKEKDIRDINQLYPIDAAYDDVAEIGKRLLIDSIEEYGWERLPEDLINIYAGKCKDIHQ
jgi:hypothetical protein